MAEIVVRNQVYFTKEVKKIGIKNICNGGINCKCLQTRDFDKDIDITDNLGYGLMQDFRDK